MASTQTARLNKSRPGDPRGSGFVDHVVDKKADIVRVYLPPDANCLRALTSSR